MQLAPSTATNSKVFISNIHCYHNSRGISARTKLCAKKPSQSNDVTEISKVATLSAVASVLLSNDQVLAAQNVAQIAANDNRGGAILLLFIPVIGWVLFNILGPAQNQLDDMTAKSKGKAPPKAKPAASPKPRPKLLKKRGIIGAIGLGLAGSTMMTMMSEEADAAVYQMSQISDSSGDGRFGAILLLFIPVIAWVLFNISGPAQNQYDTMKRANK